MKTEVNQDIREQDPSDENLEACVLALSRWKGPLPPELHHSIKEAGEHLLEDDSAVNELRNLLFDSELKDSYRAARSELGQKYRARERAKSNAATLPNGDFIRELAAFISTSDDFASAARRLVTQPDWQARAKRASLDAQIFFRTLKAAVTRLDSLSLALLRILDKDVFTLGSLAYRVELPEADVKPVLEDLWRQNYIRPLSKTVWGNFLGPFNVFTPKQGALNADHHYLGLTVKGYYCLHPHPLYRAIAQAK